MREFLCVLFLSSLTIIWTPQVFAEEGNVIGIPADLDELEIYKASDDENPETVVAANTLMFPLPILAISNNGMLNILYQDRKVWVITDDVITDLERKVDTGCEPKLAGTVVAHGKRGAGEGCD